MQDADLFLELAGIAGVFVGFGLLVAVRSGGPSEPLEVAPMRVMVSMGMLTIVAALAPVTLDRYDLADHQIWALGSALILVGWLLIFVASARTPEYRAGWATSVADARLTPGDVIGGAAFVLYMIVSFVVPIIIMLGVAPDLEAALYFTILVLILLLAAWSLMSLVFSQRRPQTASDPAALPAAGGSSA
jgi:L-asparagine transporter-like permease